MRSDFISRTVTLLALSLSSAACSHSQCPLPAEPQLPPPRVVVQPRPPCNRPAVTAAPTWPTLVPAPDGERLMAKNADFAEATVYVASLQARIAADDACLGQGAKP